jgi:hypothetical protein
MFRTGDRGEDLAGRVSKREYNRSVQYVHGLLFLAYPVSFYLVWRAVGETEKGRRVLM